MILARDPVSYTLAGMGIISVGFRSRTLSSLTKEAIVREPEASPTPQLRLEINPSHKPVTNQSQTQSQTSHKPNHKPYLVSGEYGI